MPDGQAAGVLEPEAEPEAEPEPELLPEPLPPEPRESAVVVGLLLDESLVDEPEPDESEPDESEPDELLPELSALPESPLAAAAAVDGLCEPADLPLAAARESFR